MTDHRPFHFKKFSLLHHQSTMKVGTDAMLLGTWVDVSDVRQILDIGSGCGILSLLLAQRCNAPIDAVEIDELSAKEARLNFELSPWKDRLKCYHADVKRFAENINKKYDLIITNPPFFTSEFKTKSARRNLARHTDTLDFELLIRIAERLLTEEGRFVLVLPYTEGMQFIEIAEKQEFHLSKLMKIIPTFGKDCNRLNMEFTKTKPQNIVKETFTIRNSDGEFTDQYNFLLRDFYLGL
jgi:tRNA1Val (adenine37-N6)-methyltransferase